MMCTNHVPSRQGYRILSPRLVQSLHGCASLALMRARPAMFFASSDVCRLHPCSMSRGKIT
ncbi:hypothetical protein PSP6_50041 [Paraburkholderia tropica]|nr:hypothetical protein PSP6_50041 [Paraburkholderia tropica]